MIVLLVLMLCGVDQIAIADDYMRSEKELVVDKEERVQAIMRIGLSKEFAGCPEDFVQQLTNHVQERHGGIMKYLFSIGVELEAQKRIQRITLEAAISD